VIGNNVKIQNNVSVYTGVTVEDDVFLGPSCVLTNVTNPRSQIVRHELYEKTLLRQGATVGANATIVCGVTLGRYCFIAAGATVTKDVTDYALMVGAPARRVGWMSRHGIRLGRPGPDGIMVCPESGLRYRLEPMSATSSSDSQAAWLCGGRLCSESLRCLDLPENDPLPVNLRQGTKSYREFRDCR